MGRLISYFLDKTTAGTEALVTSVRAARSEPERAGYLALGGLALGARLGGAEKLAAALRWSLPPLLVGAVLRSTLPTSGKMILMAGLVGGVIGEVEKTRDGTNPTVIGILGISGHHLAYSRLLHESGAALRPGDALPRALAWTVGLGLSTRGGVSLMAASSIAGAAVAATSTLAQSPELQDGTVSRQGIDHGGNLVLLSEGLALLGAVVPADNRSLVTFLDCARGGSGLIGQLLLVDALARR